MQWQDVIRSTLPYVITNMPKKQSIPTDCRVLCLTDADMLFWLANVCESFFICKGHGEGKTSHTSKIHQNDQDHFGSRYQRWCDTSAHANSADRGYDIEKYRGQVKILQH